MFDTIGVKLVQANAIARKDDVVWRLADWIVVNNVVSDDVLRGLMDADPEFVTNAVANIYERTRYESKTRADAILRSILDKVPGSWNHPSTRGKQYRVIREALMLVSIAFREFPLRIRKDRVEAYRHYLNKERVGRLQFLSPVTETKHEVVA